MLSNIQADSVAPIAICGRYRTGKSFLLNRLINPDGITSNTSGGFQVGPTIEACTRGIWLWSEPLYTYLEDGSKCAILFLDTEGLASTGASAEHDARMFSLAVLLSSLIIYNSVGAIDEDAISALSFVAQLTRHIQVRNGRGEAEQRVLEKEKIAQFAETAEKKTHTRRRSLYQDDSDASEEYERDDSDSEHEDDDNEYFQQVGASYTEQSISNSMKRMKEQVEQERIDAADKSEGRELSGFFPSFLWVLRDFSLHLVDELGESVTPKEYLEESLRLGEGFSSDIQAKNRVRRVLLEFFRDRHAHTLVRPVDDEDALAHADLLKSSELRPEFLRQLFDLRAKVLGSDIENGNPHVVRVKGAGKGGRFLRGAMGTPVMNPLLSKGAKSDSAIAPTLPLVKPKEIRGKRINGRMFGFLCKSYVDAINSGGVPSIGDAWGAATRAESSIAFDSAVQSFEEQVAKQFDVGLLPFDSATLDTQFQALRTNILDSFLANAVGPTVDTLAKNLREKMDSKHAELKVQNAEISDRSCRQVAESLWASIVLVKLSPKRDLQRRPKDASAAAVDVRPNDPEYNVLAYANNNEFEADLALFQRKYEEKARGPAVHKCLSAFLVTAIPPIMKAIARSQEIAKNETVRQIERDLFEAQSKLASYVGRVQGLEEEQKHLREEYADANARRVMALKTEELAKENSRLAKQEMDALKQQIDELENRYQQELFAHQQTKLAAQLHGLSDADEDGDGANKPSARGKKSKGGRDAFVSVVDRAVGGARSRRLSQLSHPSRANDSDDSDAFAYSADADSTDEAVGTGLGLSRGRAGGKKFAGSASRSEGAGSDGVTVVRDVLDDDSPDSDDDNNKGGRARGGRPLGRGDRGPGRFNRGGDADDSDLDSPKPIFHRRGESKAEFINHNANPLYKNPNLGNARLSRNRKNRDSANMDDLANARIAAYATDAEAESSAASRKARTSGAARRHSHPARSSVRPFNLSADERYIAAPMQSVEFPQPVSNQCCTIM